MNSNIASLLRPRTFLYILGGTGLFLFQTKNNLAIIELAQENEKLREQIQMSSSMITSQKLKADELHSIHNITQQALALGLEPSGVPPVEIEP